MPCGALLKPARYGASPVDPAGLRPGPTLRGSSADYVFFIWRDDIPSSAICSILSEADDVLPSDTKVREYGRHIRSLTFRQSYVKNRFKETDMVTAMGVCSTYIWGENIFPRLQQANLYLQSDDEVSLAAHFVRWPFEHLSVTVAVHTFPSPFFSAVRLLDAVGKESSNMVSFTFRLRKNVVTTWRKWGAHVVPALSAMIPQLACLRELHVDQFSDGRRLLPALGALPLLEKLRIDLASDMMENDDPHLREPYILPPGAFPCLKQLVIRSTIHNQVVLPLATLLRGITSISFSTVVTHCETLEQAHDILHVIADKWPTNTFSLYLRFHFDGTPREIEVPIRTFLPLQTCSGLRELRIESWSPINLFDEHFDALSSALPALERLRIGDSWQARHASRNWTPRTTRRSLLYFARRCPALRQLAISINFDNNVDISSLMYRQNWASPLKFLRLTCSKYTSEDAVLTLVRAIFPRLEARRVQFRRAVVQETAAHYSSDEETDGEWDAGQEGLFL